MRIEQQSTTFLSQEKVFCIRDLAREEFVMADDLCCLEAFTFFMETELLTAVAASDCPAGSIKDKEKRK